MIIITIDHIEGRKITKTVGLVKGSTIRARHIGRDIMAFIRNLVGGEINDYVMQNQNFNSNLSISISRNINEDIKFNLVLGNEIDNGQNRIQSMSGEEITIKDLSSLIARIVNYDGTIKWDTSKPAGQPRRRLDVSRAEKEFGFKASTNLETGLKKTIDWYLNQ